MSLQVFLKLNTVPTETGFAILPINANHPRWLMHYAHMSVDEAISAFSDLGAKYFIPAHWGAFKLGDDPVGYPGHELRRKIIDGNLDSARFIFMNIGGIERLRK